ncbi:uncharacterized protein LOC131946170 [Physella acuta]|uniref:uncharacterized protein LOC131946170 n=1 Tax=Physella acuta TaxID=109671 RepID=UPI0027DDE1D5|nr:uncharacterized protein LOC131946170 [Physella acuta]
MTAQITMNSTYSGKKISCRLEPFENITFIDSDDMGTLPTEDANINVTTVKAIVKDATGEELKSDTTYNIGADGPTITCQTTPAPESLNPNLSLTYEFLTPKSGRVQNNASKIYKIPTNEENDKTYTCSVIYGSDNAVASVQTIKVTVCANNVTAAASGTALSIGSTLVLSCGLGQDATLTYTWLFNDKIIDSQADWKIQLYNFTVSDIGLYKCWVGKSRNSTPNASFHAIMKPTVTRVTPGTSYSAGRDYRLKCNTGSSVTHGWSFSWTKDDAISPIKTDTYSLTNVAAAIHGGRYTCTCTYHGASSTSEPFIIAITDGASDLHYSVLMMTFVSLGSLFF